MFFRLTTYFGIPYPPAHTNLIQMMLTLKVFMNTILLKRITIFFIVGHLCLNIYVRN